MAFWLASKREGQDSDWIQRFDPRFWTVNFPRPMIASVVTTALDALRVDAVFYRNGDLGGLIWDSADTLDHPLLAYATDRDYSRTTLSFRWRSGGIIPLDQLNGPTLTIEGKDANGAPHFWLVRLWNYAVGTPTDAADRARFLRSRRRLYPARRGRPGLPEADRPHVHLDGRAGLCLSRRDRADPPVEGWVELTEIKCTGHRMMLEIGDVIVPPHGLAMATGYDDNGTQTPARLLRCIRQLGYRGSIVHYVGMSHYFRLAPVDASFLVGGAGDPLCTPARAWHLAFLEECKRHRLFADRRRCPTKSWRSIAPTAGSSATGTAIPRSPAGIRRRRCSRPPTPWR